MAIPESQLETWSHHGSITQSAATYASVRRALEDPDAPHAGRDFDVFLQGSYCNDTNIYAESDVDIVICLNSCFFYDLSALDAQNQTEVSSGWSAPQYSYESFRTDVFKALQKRFGELSRGNKAINIPADGNRRSADVVVAAEFRQYEPGHQTLLFEQGIAFFSSDGKRIANYPKQHSDACTRKQGATKGLFKPMVRILKNLRNHLIDDGSLAEGSAPSYFIEGLLYNAPPDKFDGSYGETFVECVNWISHADLTQFVCPNGMHYLYRDGAVDSWPCKDCSNFIDRVAGAWSGWS